MSFTAHPSSSYPRSNFVSGMPEENPLRAEPGWKEVASGLGKILFAHLLMFVIAVLVVLILLCLAFQFNPERMDPAKPDLGALWLVLGGGGVIVILAIVAYGMILIGKWRCALHAPERCGARWFIFCCILCIVVGPVSSFVMGFANPAAHAPVALNAKGKLPPRQALKNSPAAARKAQQAMLEYMPAPSVLQLVGPAISLAMTIFFVLFLRSVGKCFENGPLAGACDIYLMLVAVVSGGTVFILFMPSILLTAPLVALGIGLGWCGQIIGYIALVFWARIAILTGMTQIRSPFEIYEERPSYAAQEV